MNRWYIPLAVATLLLVAAVPVGAQLSGPSVDGLIADDEGSRLDQAIGALSGLADRLPDVVDAPVFGDDETGESAAVAAENARQAFNDRSGDYQRYINNRVNASVDLNAVALTFEVGDSSETLYLTADVNGSDYQSVSMVNSTSKSADETCTLRDDAARNADEEIASLHTEFVADGEDIERSYLAERFAEYQGVGPIDSEFECSINI